MADVKVTRVPGQHEFDGIQLGNIFTPESLSYIQDKFTMDKEDVLIVGFPKSGTCVNTDNFINRLV